ncbi:MAG: CAP domain-containing protein [Planctomycetes bacterium]|nr:CAP domain-containing protein [Planctomycetota bacterium]
MQRAIHRRRFLWQSTLLGTSAAVCPAAETSNAAFPLLRWRTATEVRRQPAELWRLADLINDYRQSRGLPEAALSPRLTAVAFAHVKDLLHNRPHAATGNLHCWSESMRWTGGIYRPEDKSTWPVMWRKPREIAGYDGYGFEIAASNVDNADHALRAWRDSPAHLDVILNRGVWSKPRWRWKAVGAVFYRGFACAWFGAEADTTADAATGRTGR